MTVIKEVKVLVNCQNCTIFVLSKDLQKSLIGAERSTNMNIQKFLIEGGKYVDALCENDKELS